jgi:hypothetical protein
MGRKGRFIFELMRVSLVNGFVFVEVSSFCKLEKSLIGPFPCELLIALISDPAVFDQVLSLAEEIVRLKFLLPLDG